MMSLLLIQIGKLHRSEPEFGKYPSVLSIELFALRSSAQVSINQFLITFGLSDGIFLLRSLSRQRSTLKRAKSFGAGS